MGYDLYGKAPKADSGQSYSSSIWNWPGLVDTIRTILDAEDVVIDTEWNQWYRSNGYEVSDENAVLISETILAYLGKHGDLPEAKLSMEAREIGDRNSQLLKDIMSGIFTDGSPVKHVATSASSDVSVDKARFAHLTVFMHASGGFRIC